MSIFRRQPTCQHQWKVVGASYRPGIGLKSAKSCTVDDVLRLEAGETTLTQRCTVCGYHDVTVHRGKVNAEGVKWG